MKLTDLEKQLLLAFTETDYGHGREFGPTWVWAWLEASGIPVKEARGVLGSLVKKGLASVSDYGGKGSSNYMVGKLTDEGIAAYKDLKK